MEDLPVSITWVYPSIKDGECIAYCFAYVRDPKKNNILYAGVKYEGRTCDLRSFRSSLRKTACERLIKKPIFAYFTPGDCVDNIKHKFNGLTCGTIDKKVLEKGKINISLAKFFLACANNQKYSDMGIYSDKKVSDLYLLIDEKGDYQYFTIPKNNNLVAITLGYSYSDEESYQRIKDNSPLLGKYYQNISELRKRAKFFGKEKERHSLDEYYNTSDEFLKNFGIVRDPSKEKTKIETVFADYHLDKRVIFYRVNLSNKTRAHIALMKLEDWHAYAVDTTKFNFTIDLEDNDNIYCFAYSLENTEMRGDRLQNKWRKNLHRKIAINRLIESPNIIETDFFDDWNVKDIRMWFGRRIIFFPPRGLVRLPFGLGELEFEHDEYIFEFPKYNERVYLYSLKHKRLPYLLEKIFRFIGII